jgi:predicted 3-demethylubiquinone-9 3-methyltransferase (glyoxalase superfamily)
MQKITPFLWYDKDAEEAMNFYVNMFNSNPAKKADAKIKTIKRYPEGYTEGPLAGMGGKVLTGVFEIEGQQFMALDGGPLFKPNESVSFLVMCPTQEEIDYFWNAITAEGAESQCGWCKDKWGFSWQIAPEMEKWLGQEGEAGRRATEAMMQMKKIDIAKLDAAYRGE